MALLIGSKALAYWYNNYYRTPIDFDIVATEDELAFMKKHNDISQDTVVLDGLKHLMVVNGKPVEVEILRPNTSNERMISLCYGPKVNLSLMDGPHFDAKIADPTVLLAIKKSHIDLPIRWWKHIKDYHFLNTRRDMKMDKRHIEAMEMRKAEVKARWVGKFPTPNLNMSNEDFFGKSQEVIGRVYEHDDLHLSTCFYARPLYEKIKTDQTRAMCSKELFNELLYPDRVKVVQEEAFSIALERIVIPALNKNKPYNAGDAFRWAIMRIGTTLTSGWFREFTQDNVPFILKHEIDYVGKFLSYLENKEKTS